MKPNRFAGGLLLIVAGAALQAQARPVPGGERRDSMPNRAQMEQRVRERLGGMMKEQLGLSDPQMTRLQETNRRFEERRRLLVDQERDIRMSLRDELIAGDSARQPQVGGLLDRMLKVQRQRLELLESEQKELSGFLSPVQRAKYLGVQEGMRRRLQQMRQQGGEPGMGPMQRRMRPRGLDDGMQPIGPGGPPGGNQMKRPRRPIGAGGPPPDSLSL